MDIFWSNGYFEKVYYSYANEINKALGIA